jgi:DNA-binding transcriptional regulator YhcF (GntR family)
MKVFDSQTPIYMQMREEIEKAIIKGLIKEDEMIPSIRKLSETYQINQKTAVNAVSELLNDNILYKKRGIGLFVSPGSKNKLKEVRKQQFRYQEIEKIVKTGQELGYTKDELISEIAQRFEDQGGHNDSH